MRENYLQLVDIRRRKQVEFSWIHVLYKQIYNVTSADLGVRSEFVTLCSVRLYYSVHLHDCIRL